MGRATDPEALLQALLLLSPQLRGHLFQHGRQVAGTQCALTTTEAFDTGASGPVLSKRSVAVCGKRCGLTCVANSEKERLIMSSTDRSSVRSRLRIMLYVRRNWLDNLCTPDRVRQAAADGMGDVVPHALGGGAGEHLDERGRARQLPPRRDDHDAHLHTSQQGHANEKL